MDFLADPADVALDGEYAYVLSAGQILAVPIAGGTTTVIAKGWRKASELVTDARFIYLIVGGEILALEK